MCLGNLFSPKAPPAPKPMGPAPTVKAAAQAEEYVDPKKIKDETEDDDLISTRKKKALEIKKAKEGVKQFGAIDPKSMPQSPTGGINQP